MRSRLVVLLFVAIVGCDSGPAPCIVDSDCRDFQQLCVERRCTSTQAIAEAGVRDAGRDAATRDGGRSDGGLDSGGGCPSLAGSWAVTAISAPPCGSAMVGYSTTITAASTGCSFTAASVDGAMPAVDGPFTVAAGGVVSGTLGAGGGAAQACTGQVTGGSLMLTCGACSLQLDRS